MALALAADSRAVTVADIREDDAAETAAMIASGGGRAQAVRLDVTDADSLLAGIERARAELGPIEVLVNNAGWDELVPFLETDEPFWDRVIDVNFKGCLRMTREVLPGMVERGWGRVVNIGSDAGRVGSSLESVYSGAKAAVIAFTKTIAREVARSGVTANAVCPGPTRTPMLEGMASGRRARS
ncbi:MAG TPA: SDR family oxidoreductase [Solirubrobacterales bacterium]|nr:SDR family oxidoreductase [Solirubrobacterales bacterium]